MLMRVLSVDMYVSMYVMLTCVGDIIIVGDKQMFMRSYGKFGLRLNEFVQSCEHPLGSSTFSRRMAGSSHGSKHQFLTSYERVITL